MKKYIKMNDNKNYLSLGNLFNILKNNAKIKSSAMQTELFCTIFNIKSINNTTVNNYCIGYRAIGIEYKKIYYDLFEKYKKDKTVFYNIILNILTILDEHIYNNDDACLDLFNRNKNLNKVCKDLINLSNNDYNVTKNFKKNIQELYDNNNIYECFIEFLFYVVLENKQPIYDNEFKIDISDLELKEYLRINLYEGVSYINSLLALSKKDNKYANAELGSLAFSGILSGKKDYKKSFEYYLSAAKKDHPKSCWMVSHLILTNKVGNVKKDFNILWKYLNKAIELGSIAAINTMGICFLKGITPDRIIDEEKALLYFFKASEYGYAYAYNNLGLYYERKKDYKTSYEYFKLSADLNESWALNKIGEIKRLEGDLKEAYFYYLKSSESPISEVNYYSFYNLAKYYYSCGCAELNIKKDVKKATRYFELARKNGINIK